MINYKTTKLLIYLFLFVCTVNHIFFSYRLFIRENGYILGDWLINYGGGFTRRGLFGEIIIHLSKNFDINLIKLTFIIFCIFYVYFIFLIYKIISRSNINFLTLLLILSPSTFLFSFYDPLAAGRKEFLFFIFFCLYFLYREKKIFIYSSPIIATGIILTHELFIFLCPLFFIARYLKTKSLRFRDYNLEILISCLSILILIFLFKLSNPNIQNTCEAIKNFGYDWRICFSINDLNLFRDNPGSVAEYIKGKNYIFYYSLFLILSLIPILLCLKKFFNFNIYFSFLFIIISLLPIIGLVFVVNDWGRYIHIYTFVWMLIFLSCTKIKEINLSYAKVVVLLLYSSSWYIPHCCPEIHFSKYKFKPGILYIYERIHLRFTTENTMYKS